MSPTLQEIPETGKWYKPASYDSLSTSVYLSRMLVLLALVAQIYVAWRFWATTWDDSAITLGFARSFALTGRIEPTPGSGIVEGYSTTLWMLLMTLAAKFSSNGATLLVVAKISTLLLNLANIVLMRRWFLTWTSETMANLVAGLVGCGLMFYETINGMETPLILALVLVMLLLLPLPGRGARCWYLLAGSAFLLVRWEAAWLLVPFVLVEKTFRRAFTSSAVWLTVFVASNLVRWRYFGSILPNTIIAKQNAPYSAATSILRVQRHFQELGGIIAVCKVMVLVLAAYLLYDRFVSKERSLSLESVRQSFRASWQLRFALFYTLFSLILSTAIGTNWGPPFRSFYSGWPFLICLLLLPVISNQRSRFLPWATVALCVATLLRMFVRGQEMASKPAPFYMPGTTVGDVALKVPALSEVQNKSRHRDIVYAGPDMGALLLYSNGVRVVDLGLLCDRVLAHQGMGAVESYVLRERRPDVIEVHQNWIKYTGLHESTFFREHYRVVYVGGIRLFLNRSLIADIDASNLIEKPFDSSGRPSAVDITPRDLDGYYWIDYALNKDFGSYLVFK